MINLKNLLRIGKVSSLNYKEGKVRVCFEDQDGIVTDELPMLSFEYELPAVNELVLCLFLGNGITKGFVLGRFFYDGDPPVDGGYGKDIYFKRFLKDATLKYDRAAKTWTLTSNEIVFNGNLTINGNLTVNGDTQISGNTDIGGNLKVGGKATIADDAIIGGKSFLNHTHPDAQGGATGIPS